MTKTLSKKIDKLIDVYFDYVKFKTLGPHAIHHMKVKKLLRAGLITKEDLKSLGVRDMYLKTYLIAHPTVSQDRLPRVKKQIIRHLQERAGHYVDKFKDDMKAEVKSIIQHTELEYRNKGVLGSRKINKELAEKMHYLVKEKITSMSNDWQRTVVTELAHSSNMGAFDAIVDRNEGKDLNEVIVYKVGPNDLKTCPKCKEFWFNSDGSYKEYKLSELIENGSNYKKKAAEWLPTVELTHPRCRHLLVESVS